LCASQLRDRLRELVEVPVRPHVDRPREGDARFADDIAVELRFPEGTVELRFPEGTVDLRFPEGTVDLREFIGTLSARVSDFLDFARAAVRAYVKQRPEEQWIFIPAEEESAGQ
jgi:hypothetical protein